MLKCLDALAGRPALLLTYVTHANAIAPAAHGPWNFHRPPAWPTRAAAALMQPFLALPHLRPLHPPHSSPVQNMGCNIIARQ